MIFTAASQAPSCPVTLAIGDVAGRRVADVLGNLRSKAQEPSTLPSALLPPLL